MNRLHCLVIIALSLLSYVAARPGSSVLSHPLRLLQQQPQNCTPPRSSAATQQPFCFVPDTISSEAKQVLSRTAAGATPFGATPPPDATPEQSAGYVQQAREFYRQLNIPLQAVAIQRHLQSPKNDTIANIPVVIAVPQGVNETTPADTKVLMYLHGKFCIAVSTASFTNGEASPCKPPAVLQTDGLACMHQITAINASQHHNV